MLPMTMLWLLLPLPEILAILSSFPLVLVLQRVMTSPKHHLGFARGASSLSIRTCCFHQDIDVSIPPSASFLSKKKRMPLSVSVVASG